MRLLRTESDFMLPSSFLKETQTKKSKCWYNDTIITFDIETTSYRVPIPGDSEGLKQGLCYVWMLSVAGQRFYGRHLKDFRNVLKYMKDKNLGRVIIYIHNLGFEFQFLRNIISDFDVFARTPHKPMKASSDELNVEFRCSLMLYNMSLQKVGDKVKIPKLIGDLDYTKIRTPETPLTETELGYCEHDILILDAAISMEVLQYGSVAKIPLTHTGRIRLEVQAVYKDNYRYRRRLRRQLVKTLDLFLRQQWTFAGGYTHANATYSGDIIYNVYQNDRASAYPFEMVTRMYPTAWTKYTETDIDAFDIHGRYCWMLNLRFTDLRCVTQNTYISYSKVKCRDPDLDNGRVVSAEELTLWCTELDFDTIRKTYVWDKIEVLESWRSRKAYLDRDYVMLILRMYARKTKLKGVKGAEDEYARLKELINSLYGMMVTQTIRDEVVFNGSWGIDPLTEEMVEELLEKQSKRWNTLLNFSWGIWVTAWARHSLWEAIILNDDRLVYTDTDSIKTDGPPVGLDKLNEEWMQLMYHVSEVRGIDFDLFCPKDLKDIRHPLGVFEDEGIAAEFKTLGAKKYAERHQDGSIELTVAGVNKKKGSAYLKNLEDFDIGFTFPPEAAGKMTVYYNEDQVPYILTDYTGQKYEASDKYGICLEPTGYTVSVLPYYLEFSNERATIYRRGVIYDE